MPLIGGKKAKTSEGFSENVSREVHAGKPQKQAVAIAYSQAGEKKKVKKSDILSTKAVEATMAADKATEKTFAAPSFENHKKAAEAHHKASDIHQKEGNRTDVLHHGKLGHIHEEKAKQAQKRLNPIKKSDPVMEYLQKSTNRPLFPDQPSQKQEDHRLEQKRNSKQGRRSNPGQDPSRAPSVITHWPGVPRQPSFSQPAVDHMNNLKAKLKAKFNKSDPVIEHLIKSFKPSTELLSAKAKSPGTTSSGTKIHAYAAHPSHEDFTEKEHNEAAGHHEKLSQHYKTKQPLSSADENDIMAEHHRIQQQVHHHLAGEARSKKQSLDMMNDAFLKKSLDKPLQKTDIVLEHLIKMEKKKNWKISIKD